MDSPKDKKDKRKKSISIITPCIQPSTINRRYQNDKLPFTGEVIEMQPIDVMDNEELKSRSYRDQGDGFYES